MAAIKLSPALPPMKPTTHIRLTMLNINPQIAPFTLTPDNQVPEAIRDTAYWDDGGDVLLVTKDGVVVFLRMNMLIRYSETIKGLLSHISGVPQDDLWTPILELQCSAEELRAVLEYLRLNEQYVDISLDTTSERQPLRNAQGDSAFCRLPCAICPFGIYVRDSDAG